MRQGYTHIAMVLDRSGSMTNCWTETKGSYQAFIDKQKASAKGEVTFSLFAFDDDCEEKLSFVDIDKVSGRLDFCPRGMTRLRDSVGKALTVTYEGITKMPEGERPSAVLVVIQTDGGENASTEWNQVDLKALIASRKEMNWELLFVGADEAGLTAASDIGIERGKMAFYEKGATKATFAGVAAKAAAYSQMNMCCSTPEEMSRGLDFTDEEREDFLDKGDK